MEEPKKISELSQAQRNALITALGCKTIYRMNNGDPFPIDLEPDEIVIKIPFPGADGILVPVQNIPTTYRLVYALSMPVGSTYESLVYLADENYSDFAEAILYGPAVFRHRASTTNDKGMPNQIYLYTLNDFQGYALLTFQKLF